MIGGKMQLNMELLVSLGACKDGKAWYAAHPYPTVQGGIADILSDELCPRRSVWANWLIVRVLSSDNNIRYAIYASGLVLHHFENKYPDDNRPQKAIRAAKKYLKAGSVAAAWAARASGAAAWAARASEASAGAAARAAARAAAGAAARAAAEAAGAAARADAEAAGAAGDAAYNKTLAKIVKYGIKLLNQQEATC
jgi:hypothetical protein